MKSVNSHTRLLWMLLMCGASASCGDSPASPSTGGSGGGGGGISQSCRTYAATYRIVSTSTTNGTCTFNPSTIEGTCTNTTSTAGGVITTVFVTRHASRGDVVDEVSVIPPLNRAFGTTTTITSPTGNSSGTSTLVYDSQRRLVSVTAVSQPSGQSSTTMYSAWDSAGRPTAGTQGATALTYSYNDSTRTQTLTSAGVTCTQTFDQNGNPAVGVCGGVTATTTVLSTAQVCR